MTIQNESNKFIKRTRGKGTIPKVNISTVLKDDLSKTLKIPKAIAKAVVDDLFSALYEIIQTNHIDLVIPYIGRLEFRNMAGTPTDNKTAELRTLYPPGSFKVKFKPTVDNKMRSKLRIFQKLKDGRYQVNKWFSHLYEDDGVPKEVDPEEWFDLEKVRKLLYKYSTRKDIDNYDCSDSE